MKENKYNDEIFFNKYSQMERSKNGLSASAEWHEVKKLLPDLKDKNILDLGCGYGWHCRYFSENNASSIIGIDISNKMLKKALEINNLDNIVYINTPIEEIYFPEDSFDIVISSLVLHYIEDLDMIFSNINIFLKDKGNFIFSIEHPVFTAYGNQDWFYNENGEKLHWPVDNYFINGKRETIFLGEKIIKYHRSLTNVIQLLIKNNFNIVNIVEPAPSDEMLELFPDLIYEFKRPMMLIISAENKKSL